MDFLDKTMDMTRDMETDSERAMREAEMERKDVNETTDQFGKEYNPDTQTTVDDGADTVLMGAKMDRLDPFADTDNDSSFDEFDDLEVTNVEMNFDMMD